MPRQASPRWHTPRGASLRSAGWSKKQGKIAGLITTLPGGYRPKQRLIFNVSTHDSASRVDVLPNGQVLFLHGNTKHGWVSLDGITFALGKEIRLPLVSGQNFGARYPPVSVKKIGNTVVLSGLMKNSKTHHVTTLPAGFRPRQRRVFNLLSAHKSGYKAAQVEVLPNGRIHWLRDGSTSVWLNFYGIAFPNERSSSGFQIMRGWGAARITPDDALSLNVVDYNRVMLSGRIRVGSGSHMITLPKKMLPKHRMIFNLNTGGSTLARVDVLPNGMICWVWGAANRSWVSLAGISYTIGGLPKTGASATNCVKTTVVVTKESGPQRAMPPLPKEVGQHLKKVPAFSQSPAPRLTEKNRVLIGTMKVGRNTATVVTWRPQNNKPFITALLVSAMTIKELLPKLKSGNPMSSYAVNDVVVFTVPYGGQMLGQKIAALPKIVANAVKKTDPAFTEKDAAIDLAPGMTYFGTVRMTGLVKYAADLMGVRNPMSLAGSLALTEYSKPQNTVTLTARLKKDPLTKASGLANLMKPVQFIKVDKSAKPSLFVTATGT